MRVLQAMAGAEFGGAEAFFTRLAVALWASAMIIHEMSGWNTTYIIWGIGMLTAVYTLLGGLSAVIYTESIQTVIMYIGGIILAVLCLNAVGGWSGLTEQLPRQHMHWKYDIHHETLPWTAFTLPWFIGGMFYWCMDQTIVQRAFGAKSLDHARKASIFAGYLKLGHLFIFVIPGLCALILAPKLPNSDQAYGYLIKEMLPVGVRGLLLAAVLAAIMSTLASTYNSTATLVVRDFVLKFNPKASNAQQILIGRISIIFMALAGILWAPNVQNIDASLWEYIMMVSIYLQMPVVGIFMLGMLWKRTNSTAAIVGLVVGVVIGMTCLIDDMVETVNLPIISWWFLKPFAHRGFLAFLTGSAITIIWTLWSKPAPAKAELETLTVNWKNPQLLTSEARSRWSDWRLWLFGLIVIDLFLYFKLM